MSHLLRGAFAAVSLVHAAVSAAALSVIEPSIDARVAEGFDYSVNRVGNRWDMSDPGDIVTSESKFLVNEVFANGIYTADVPENATDPRFFLIYPGVISAFNGLESGQKFPVSTQQFRYLTIKIRHLSPDGTARGDSHAVQVFYFDDESSITQGTFGYTVGKPVPSDGDWHILTFDLIGDESPDSNHSWLSFADVRGLRIDPTTRANTRIEIDWVRLTGAGNAATGHEVRWSGGTGPYTVTADGPEGSRFVLGESIATTSLQADFSLLPPGPYAIRVSDPQGSDTSPGRIIVNTTPQFHFVEPDIRGDTARSYGLVEAGNPWGPIDSADVASTRQLTSISYGNPAGTLTATSTGSDPGITLATPLAVETNHYRMLSYTLSVSGPRDIGQGSVARVLWGESTNAIKTSEDIVVQEGINRYDLGDMRNMPLEGGSAGQWTGLLRVLRLDPHEFSVARDIRLDEVLLAPLDTADPSFDISWIDDDPDDDASISIYVDVDKIPGNGNEKLIESGIREDSGIDVFTWLATADVADGEFHLYAILDDGLNRLTRYATGPIKVGTGAGISVDVVEPDGTDDVVVAADEFSRVVEGDAWDFSNSGDVPLARSKDVTGQTISGGLYSATTTGNDPYFYLTFPGATAGHEGSNGLVNPIDPLRYRYLTFKVRITASDPVFFNVYYHKDANFTAQSTGYTDLQTIFPGQWVVKTIDLQAQTSASSPFTWNDAGQVVGLRIDPANTAGVNWEFDWFTLTGPASTESQYTVKWQVSEAGDSLLDVLAVDAGGHRIPMVADLSPNALNAQIDFTRLPVGEYGIELDANPGGVFVAPGSVQVLPKPTGTTEELLNISTRAEVRTGADIMIGGFIITGDLPQCVLVVGRGPSVGVSGDLKRLPDPVLTLKSGQTTIARNDNWQIQDNPAHVSVISSLPWAPKDILEAAVYACLEPGAYTALLTDYTNSTGIGLIEVYDADPGPSYLYNISTRSWVGTGGLISIAGFVISGTEPRTVLVRGLGPSMSPKLPAGTDVLDNPYMRLYSGQTVIATNDNWTDAVNADQIAALSASLVPDYPVEPAILVTLEPGTYTAHLLGVGGDTGLGNIAVYDLTGK